MCHARRGSTRLWRLRRCPIRTRAFAASAPASGLRLVPQAARATQAMAASPVGRPTGHAPSVQQENSRSTWPTGNACPARLPGRRVLLASIRPTASRHATIPAVLVSTCRAPTLSSSPRRRCIAEIAQLRVMLGTMSSPNVGVDALRVRQGLTKQRQERTIARCVPRTRSPRRLPRLAQSAASLAPAATKSMAPAPLALSQTRRAHPARKTSTARRALLALHAMAMLGPPRGAPRQRAAGA